MNDTFKMKNDTNTPEVLEVLVLKVGPGLGQMVKEPVKRKKYLLILKYIFIV